MLKQAMRKASRMARQWFKEDRGRTQDLDPSQETYPLRAAYLKIQTEKGCRHKYSWGVMHSVHLAKALGLDRVSAIEFGVAGGNGLIALENIADKVQTMYGVRVDVFGFDTGVGLPKPRDYRDMPNLWTEGYFPMDVEKLRSRLRRAQVILGPVEKTISQFLESGPAPVAFAAFDVDLYSSTAQALRLFDAHSKVLLPRIHCYFDDVCGWTFGDHIGERLAISEFNASHALRKISQIYGLRHFIPSEYADQIWWEKYYMAHLFDHELYGSNDRLIDGREAYEELGLS